MHNCLHIGPKALYNFLSPIIHSRGLRQTLEDIQATCTVCNRSNHQGALHVRHPLHQMKGHLPGQDWQLDFTHMPKHKNFRYLLTFIDTFSGWIEAFPTARETADAVTQVLI